MYILLGAVKNSSPFHIVHSLVLSLAQALAEVLVGSRREFAAGRCTQLAARQEQQQKRRLSGFFTISSVTLMGGIEDIGSDIFASRGRFPRDKASLSNMTTIQTTNTYR